MARAMKAKTGVRPVARARVCVAEPAQLCGVQKTTRELCRSAGFSEGAVFQAVIAVTELAYRLHLESARRVELKLSALRRKNGLELRAENVDPGGLASVRVRFPHE